MRAVEERRFQRVPLTHLDVDAIQVETSLRKVLHLFAQELVVLNLVVVESGRHFDVVWCEWLGVEVGKVY